jgi:small subunit ribosomal protein S20
LESRERVAKSSFGNLLRAVVKDARPTGFTQKSKNKKFIIKMANHKSSLKRIRQDKVKTLHNKYYAKTMRNAVRKLRAMTNKEEAEALYPKVQKMLDKLAKTNIIHKNKAANLKSGLVAHINKLG